MADGGCDEALYEGLFPDQSLDSVLEPKYTRSGTTDFYENHWVAEQDGRIVGGLHAFPFDDYENDPPADPRVPKERFVLLEPFEKLPAPGTYFIDSISVYPDYCRRGIGEALLILACDHARQAAFAEISLYVYGGNTGAVRLYEKTGFKIIGREPVVEHRLVRFTGEAFLMVAAL